MIFSFAQYRKDDLQAMKGAFHIRLHFFFPPVQNIGIVCTPSSLYQIKTIWYDILNFFYFLFSTLCDHEHSKKRRVLGALYYEYWNNECFIGIFKYYSHGIIVDLLHKPHLIHQGSQILVWAKNAKGIMQKFIIWYLLSTSEHESLVGLEHILHSVMQLNLIKSSMNVFDRRCFNLERICL